MNFFVIMPFEPEFDDVYSTIKQTVESATISQSGRCFRLDENRPAGRITDRLLGELRTATCCIADLTGNKPNVMWEVGFAMALSKPIIVLTQSAIELPFDIKDLQSIQYRRNHLSGTLIAPLRRMIVDTLAGMSVSRSDPETSASNNNTEFVGTLLKEMAQLKEIVAEVVHTWKSKESPIASLPSELESFCGHWLHLEGSSHIYVRVVCGELLAPYCFEGNDELTGVFFGWRRTGDYWFARFRWVRMSISGFCFLRRDTVDTLTGTWWAGAETDLTGDTPPRGAGSPITLVRQTNGKTPSWAEVFFEDVKRDGLTSYLEIGRLFHR
jgi:hypothetical protein